MQQPARERAWDPPLGARKAGTRFWPVGHAPVPARTTGECQGHCGGVVGYQQQRQVGWAGTVADVDLEVDRDRSPHVVARIDAAEFGDGSQAMTRQCPRGRREDCPMKDAAAMGLQASLQG
jgi:hypothetical protein